MVTMSTPRKMPSILIPTGVMPAKAGTTRPSGLAFDNTAYLITATLVILAFVLAYIAFMCFVWKIDLTPLKEFDVSKMNLTEADLKMNSRQKAAL